MAKRTQIIIGGLSTYVEAQYLGRDDDKAPADCGWYLVSFDLAGYRIAELGPFDNARDCAASLVQMEWTVKMLARGSDVIQN